MSPIGVIRSRVLSGGAWALGGRVALAFIGLTTNALLARLLSPAELGVYFLAYSMVGICASLGALGLKQAIVRFVAESVGLEQYERTRRSIKIALSLGSLGAVAVSVSYLFLGSKLAGLLFDSPALAAVAGLMAGWILTAALQSIIGETFRGFHNIRLTIMLGGVANGSGILTGGLLSLLLLLFWVFKGEASLSTVILLAVLSGSATTLLAGLLLQRRVAKLPRSNSSPKLRASELMHVAWPLMITNIAMFALVQSGVWVAGAFLGQEEVALYGASFRLMIYVAVPLQIANMLAPPLIAELYAQGRIEELQRTLRAVATVASIPAFLLLTAFVLFGSPIMGLIFGDYYREGATLLALLSLGQMVKVWTGPCEQGLSMTGHQTTMMTITLGTGLLTVLSTVWAAHYYGATGIAAAVASGFVLQNIVMLLVVKKKIGVWTHPGLAGILPALRTR